LCNSDKTKKFTCEKKHWNIWDCGLLKREETELTYWKFSGCIKVYQVQLLHSTTALFCKLPLAPEDIQLSW